MILNEHGPHFGEEKQHIYLCTYIFVTTVWTCGSDLMVVVVRSMVEIGSCSDASWVTSCCIASWEGSGDGDDNE